MIEIEPKIRTAMLKFKSFMIRSEYNRFWESKTEEKRFITLFNSTKNKTTTPKIQWIKVINKNDLSWIDKE